MKKTTPLALVIPPAIQPKPTKMALVAAMVERLRVKHEAEAQLLDAAKEKAKLALNKKVSAWVKKNINAAHVDSVRKWGQIVKIDLEVIDADLLAEYTAYNNLPSLSRFDEKHARAQILERLNGSKDDAMLAILGNPEAVKAMDTWLAA